MRPVRLPGAKRAPKYGNVKTGGFDSKREARHAMVLRAELAAGKITALRAQVTFVLIPSQYVDGKCVERACAYRADFTCIRNGVLEVIDAKGFKTPDYIIKRKLLLFVHGLRVIEV